jgi:hypothetical protein
VGVALYLDAGVTLRFNSDSTSRAVNSGVGLTLRATCNYPVVGRCAELTGPDHPIKWGIVGYER